MKPLSALTASQVKVVFTDIDDTLTDKGQLQPQAFQALWNLYKAGFHIVPVTGRPAGWCELIARQWPVRGVIGENGGLYFTYKNRKMHRFYMLSESERQSAQKKLKKIQKEILQKVPQAAVASDQFCRLLDLAIDFAEDVGPLPLEDVKKIVQIFKSHGAQAKISSIHVNGWFGNYNKLSTCQLFIQKELQLHPEDQECFVFIGDSPNDEPMFQFFQNSVGVQNFLEFQNQVSSPPQYITSQPRGEGFAELAQHLINCSS